MITLSMQVNRIKINKLFFRGSKKYFLATILIPPSKREKITILYNFSRYVDDLVDEKHYDKKRFNDFRERFIVKFDKNQFFGVDVVDNFIELANESHIDKSWIDALFEGVGTDTQNKRFNNITDTEKYSYGVAEVVGLMVCKVLNIDKDAYPYAQLAGRAAQWANFLRDAYKDHKVGRIYFPANEFSTQFELPYSDAEFEQDVRKQIRRYWDYRNRSKIGYMFLPWYMKLSVETAAKVDDFIVRAIEKDPSISFNKPFRFREALIIRTLKWM